jgi:hypothetical protein
MGSNVVGGPILVCPIHKVALRKNRFFHDYLMHDGCLELYKVIDGRLCVLRDGQWLDTETSQIRYAKPSGN